MELFFRRVEAFLLDVLILAIALEMLSLVFPTNNNVVKLNKEFNTITDNYLNGDLEYSKYIHEAGNIEYLVDREQIFYNVMNVILVIIFFVFIPFLNNGSTLGKKVMKLKIVDKEGNKPNMNILIIRSLIFNSLGYLLITLAAIFIVKDYNYFILTIILSIIELLLVIISIFMILYRSDKRGVHDFIAGTKVVKI
jgi:uncharacterized RDD family membrane protein YckC